MRGILHFLRLPIVKILATILIFYFALLHDKSNPRSLGARLASEDIKGNFLKAQEQGKFILQNVQMAKNIKSDQARSYVPQVEQNFGLISVQDIRNGDGGDMVKCGDVVYIHYEIGLAVGGDENIEAKNMKIVVGSGVEALIEQKIIGMKLNGMRELLIPKNFVTNDQKLAALLKFNQKDLVYRITLLGFAGSSTGDVNCESNVNYK